MAELRRIQTKNRRIRGSVKLGQRLFVDLRNTLRVQRHDCVEDGGVRRKRRTARQDLRKGELVGPDERQPVLEPPQSVFQFVQPELLALRRADHHDQRRRVGPEPQDVFDHRRRVVLDRDRRLVGGQGAALEEATIDRGQQERRPGKELLVVLFREHGRRSADCHHEIEPAAVERGPQVRNLRFVPLATVGARGLQRHLDEIQRLR